MLSRDCDDLRRRLEENADACEEADRAFKDKKQALEDVKAQRRDVEDRRDEWQQKVRDLEADAASHQELPPKPRTSLKALKRNIAAFVATSTVPYSASASYGAWNRNTKAWAGPLRSSLRHSSLAQSSLRRRR